MTHGKARRGAARAFTLLEVLLVLALIGVLSGVLVVMGTRLLTPQPRTAQDVFWAAVQEARKMALKDEVEVALKFVDDREAGKVFVVSGGSAAKTFVVPEAGDLEVSFLAPQAGGSLIMIAGTVLETRKVPYVSFYPDGTCSPFRVQFFRGGAVEISAIDPWTCAPALRTGESNS